MDIYDNHSKWPDNEIHPTAIIHPSTVMGKGNKIGAYSVIGGRGEIRDASDFQGIVHIGDNNTISELVTIQRPQVKGQKTAVGDNNLIMAHSHIGHDAIILDHCEISTGTIIGGYARIDKGVRIKLGCTIRNRIKIGEKAIIGMGSNVVNNVLTNTLVCGNPAKEMI